MNYARIQLKVDHGLGIAAKHLGQPYSAYRVDPTAFGDFPQGWRLVRSNYPLYRVRRTEAKVESAIPRAALLYDLFSDMSPFLLGDCFVVTDPPYANGVSYGAGATSVPGTNELNALAFANHNPAAGDFKNGPNTGIRLTHLARIYRPSRTPTTLSDNSRYWKSTLDADQALVLAGGDFAFVVATEGQPASLIPVGFAAAFRPSGSLPFGPPPPTVVRPSHWYCYVPPLPGWEPREGDAIITQDDQRYVIIDPYRQESGVVGNFLMCDRWISQPG